MTFKSLANVQAEATLAAQLTYIVEWRRNVKLTLIAKPCSRCS